ncbi:hypothetical protein PP178_00910 [Zeaxanthinibacter sp. PT1]|uniref:hypothetical protein n=1 Tax=Zeaxanthinibacter TaxID=561554 RepID=UPI002349503C|nr:hypothetical protein [Zeaxanthinibacter sp. PT1]MDC6350096.1 hypothetical protein [Zeaxanthinibacter sp. PT1]
MRSLCMLISLIGLVSCSSKSNVIRPAHLPEIPTAQLNQRGIAAINPEYKRNYFTLLPYLFYNRDGSFNELQGDFYNLKYGASSNVNIMPGYWKDYGSYKNVLVVLIALSNSSTQPINNVPIKVVSSKNGAFKKGKLGYSAHNKSQQRILFIRELNLMNQYDILEKVNDDVITVSIGEVDYEFLNPELQL